MTKLPLGIAALAMITSAIPAFAQSGASDLAPFPAAEEGLIRQVIQLEEQPDEDLLRLEIVAGKMLEVDCNRVLVSATLTTKTIEGWGYDYHVIDKVSEPAKTMMACPDDKTETAFVPLNLGAEATQRYNSKLPVVVYAPADVAVKYRIWRADPALSDAVAQ